MRTETWDGFLDELEKISGALSVASKAPAAAPGFFSRLLGRGKAPLPAPRPVAPAATAPVAKARPRLKTPQEVAAEVRQSYDAEVAKQRAIDLAAPIRRSTPVTTYRSTGFRPGVTGDSAQAGVRTSWRPHE